MKVALVHDWLNGMRGGEKVLELFCELFPDAPIYTLHCDREKLSPFLQSRTIYTSFIQYLPFRKQKYRYYLPLFPLAIRQFNLDKYDLVLSLSHCAAKGVFSKKIHICYCFTPVRYAWDFYDEYFKSHYWVMRYLIKWGLDFFKKWDLKTSRKVTAFIGISHNIQAKIKRIYSRDSQLVYPPVDTDFYQKESCAREDFFLVVSALVPYKKVDMAIEACNTLNVPLKVIGTGPTLEALQKKAGNSIEFLGWQSDETLRRYYSRARALIFPGEEDFGIVPLEAMACGCPVIAFAKGGALETIVDKETGLFFNEQSVESLKQAILDSKQMMFDDDKLREQSLKFSKQAFKENLRATIDKIVSQH